MIPIRYSRRRLLSTWMLAAAVLVIVASVAYACVPFKGQMWVQKGTANEGHSYGNGTSMDLCANATNTTGKITNKTAYPLEVAPTVSTDPCGAQQLVGGTDYKVAFVRLDGHCHGDVLTGNTSPTSLPVSTNGTGSGNFTTTLRTVPQNGYMCVAHPGGNDGIVVPVTVS